MAENDGIHANTDGQNPAAGRLFSMLLIIQENVRQIKLFSAKTENFSVVGPDQVLIEHGFDKGDVACRIGDAVTGIEVVHAIGVVNIVEMVVDLLF